MKQPLVTYRKTKVYLLKTVTIGFILIIPIRTNDIKM